MIRGPVATEADAAVLKLAHREALVWRGVFPTNKSAFEAAAKALDCVVAPAEVLAQWVEMHVPLAAAAAAAPEKRPDPKTFPEMQPLPMHRLAREFGQGVMAALVPSDAPLCAVGRLMRKAMPACNSIRYIATQLKRACNGCCRSPASAVLRALCRFEAAQRGGLTIPPRERLARCNATCAQLFNDHMSAIGSRGLRTALSRMLLATAARDPLAWFLATRIAVDTGAVRVASTLAKAVNAFRPRSPAWGFAAPAKSNVAKRLAEAASGPPSAKRFRQMLHGDNEAREAVGRMAAAFTPHCRFLTVPRLRHGPPCWSAFCNGKCGWLMSAALPNQPPATVDIDGGNIKCGRCGRGTSPANAGALLFRNGRQWLTGCYVCGQLCDAWTVRGVDIICDGCGCGHRKNGQQR